MNDIASIKFVFTSIDWTTDTFLASLLGLFYCSCIFLTYVTRKHLNIQAVYFVLMCAGIYFAENINKFCAKNWKQFSVKNQYFDSRGLFISVVFSVPLLLNLLVIVFLWMRMAGGDLVSLKRKELWEQQKNKEKKTE